MSAVIDACFKQWHFTRLLNGAVLWGANGVGLKFPLAEKNIVSVCLCVRLSFDFLDNCSPAQLLSWLVSCWGFVGVQAFQIHRTYLLGCITTVLLKSTLCNVVRGALLTICSSFYFAFEDRGRKSNWRNWRCYTVFLAEMLGQQIVSCSLPGKNNL